MKNCPFSSPFLPTSNSIFSTITNSISSPNSIATNSVLLPFYSQLHTIKSNFSLCLLSIILSKPLTKSISSPTSQFSSKILSQKCTSMMSPPSSYPTYIRKTTKCSKLRCLMVFSSCSPKESSILPQELTAAISGSPTTLMLSFTSPLRRQ